MTLPSEWLGSAAAVIGTLSFICALGFSRRDWLTGLGTLAGAVTGTLSAVRTGALWTADTVRRVRSTDPLDLDGPIPADDLDDIDPIAPAEMPARRERAAVDSAPDAGKKGLIARARERKAAKSKKALIAPPAAKARSISAATAPTGRQPWIFWAAPT